jgi:hypothetical protein
MVADLANTLGGWGEFGLFVLAAAGAGLGAHRWMRTHVAEPLKQVPAISDRLEVVEHTLTVNGNIADPPTILDRLQNVERSQGAMRRQIDRKLSK